MSDTETENSETTPLEPLGSIEINSKEEYDQACQETHKDLVVIMHYADWCNPSKMIAPKIKEMMPSFPDFVLYRINSDNFAEIADELDIKVLPTFFFYKKGKKEAEILGANENKFRDYLAKHTSKVDVDVPEKSSDEAEAGPSSA